MIACAAPHVRVTSAGRWGGGRGRGAAVGFAGAAGGAKAAGSGASEAASAQSMQVLIMAPRAQVQARQQVQAKQQGAAMVANGGGGGEGSWARKVSERAWGAMMALRLGSPCELLFVWAARGRLPPCMQVLIMAPLPHRCAPFRLGGAGVATPRVREASRWRPPLASTIHITAAPRPRRCIPSCRAPCRARALPSTCRAPCRARLRTSPRRSIASRRP